MPSVGLKFIISSHDFTCHITQHHNKINEKKRDWNLTHMMHFIKNNYISYLYENFLYRLTNSDYWVVYQFFQILILGTDLQNESICLLRVTLNSLPFAPTQEIRLQPTPSLSSTLLDLSSKFVILNHFWMPAIASSGISISSPSQCHIRCLLFDNSISQLWPLLRLHPQSSQIL